MTKQKILGWDGSEVNRPKHIRSLRKGERRKVDARLLSVPAFTSKAKAYSAILDPNTAKLEESGDNASEALLTALQHRGLDLPDASPLVAPAALSYGSLSTIAVHTTSPSLSLTPSVTGVVDTWSISASPTGIVFSPASGRLSGLTTLSPGASETVVVTSENEAGTDTETLTLFSVSP